MTIFQCKACGRWLDLEHAVLRPGEERAICKECAEKERAAVSRPRKEE